MKHGRLLQIATVVMFVVFLSWAGFQYNDPDAWVWVIVYGLAAVCCVLFYLHRLSPTFGLLLASVTLAWAAVLGFLVLTTDEPFTFVDDNVGEVLRESLGLVVVGAWVGYLSLVALRSKRTTGT